MKALFLVFHGFAEGYNGITKKIYSQVAAMNACGVSTVLCYTAFGADGSQLRMVDDKVLDNFGRGQAAKVYKRTRWKPLTDYIAREGITMVYARANHNANPFLIRLFSRLRRMGVKVVMEIPTYPYDQEYDGTPLGFRSRLYVDRLFRNCMGRSLFRIATFANLDEIFGAPTIRISNGIDFDRVPLRKRAFADSSKLNLIGVAEIHTWHGFDRVIAGLAQYYAAGRPAVEVTFHVVGEGFQGIGDQLRAQAAALGVADRVVFHGPLGGVELDEAFERADMGVASLARHRSGITHIKTLKNREYAGRGIPFVYSETDDDFETMPYVMKAPADETPIDIAALVEFYRTAPHDPAAIRASVEGTLSWQAQMRKVIDEIENSK